MARGIDKNDMRNLVLTRLAKSLKIWTLMGYFCQKYVMFELKKLQRSCVVKNQSVFKNDIRNLVNFQVVGSNKGLLLK